MTDKDKSGEPTKKIGFAALAEVEKQRSTPATAGGGNSSEQSMNMSMGRGPLERQAGATRFKSANVISRLMTRAKGSHALKPPSAPSYHRIIVDGDEGDAEYETCAELIANCIMTRQRYKDNDTGVQEVNETQEDPVPGPGTEISFDRGIFTFSGQKTLPVDWKKYITDVKLIFKAMEDGPCLSAARSRLTILQEEFELYTLLNTQLEEDCDPMRRGGGVFSTSTKVDNSVRLHSSMTALQLVDHISKIANTHGDYDVDVVNGAPLTLIHMMRRQLGVSEPNDITVEGLGLHPPMVKRFRRFDALDPKLNIGGEGSAELLQLFLKHNNFTRGKLFADVVKPLLQRHEAGSNKIIATEYKLPLYGGKPDELEVLAAWTKEHDLNRFTRNMWILQIPRQQDLRPHKKGVYTCTNNGEQLRNLFEPMFKATLNPQHPELKNIAQLLNRVGAITVYSDEAQRRKNFHSDPEDPSDIPWGDVPDDYYFFYYVWANLWSLNCLRARKGLNTIQFRPTAGETQPHFDQLVSGYLLADNINQGLRLDKSWFLQYLYMFGKVGIVMSPLANNAMNVPYFSNPFPTFFKRGLNVTLGTEDPLHIHHNSEPLFEEYGTAKRGYKMTATDMSELALTSVLLSSFPHEIKGHWLGTNYAQGPDGNDISKSNVSDFRLQFRQECLYHEQTVLNLMLSNKKSGIIVSTVRARRNNMSTSHAEEDNYRNRRRINYTDRRVAYPRIDIFGGFDGDSRYEGTGAPLRDVLMLRGKYQEGNSILERRAEQRGGQDVTVEDAFKDKSFKESYWEFNNFYGVYVRYPIGTVPNWPSHIPTMREFVNDVNAVSKVVVGMPDLVALAHHRLQLLEHKFGLHVALNITRESGKKEEKAWNNRDFFTAAKVDGNVQLDAGMNARMMLGFFKSKALNNGHDIVEEGEGNRLITLNELLKSLDMTRESVERLTVDELGYLLSPTSAKNESLRTLFLHTDNYMGGRYFAELTQLSFEKHKKDAYTFVENRLVIRGKDTDEWDKLSSWFDRYGMSSKQNRWMITIPRQYRKLRMGGHVTSFGDWLERLFEPLWEVSLRPAALPKFHYFLSHVSGFDTVDDESKVDIPLSDVLPHEWKDEKSPPYLYYLYFLWANINSLNEFRSSRGLSTFKFRPQCGEQGGVEHLVGGFLLAQSINHGVQLSRFPVLEYLFFISQIGLTVSPLANTASTCEYLKNPFPKFFRRGLKVSLATSKPLHFHFTEEPLIEEYAIASKIWKLSYNDLCEIARISVQISGFKDAFRVNALGKHHQLDSTIGNDVRLSRVSDIRIAYRFEVYHQEISFLDELLNGESMPKAVRSLEEEVQIWQTATGKNFEMPEDDEPEADESAPGSPANTDYGSMTPEALNKLIEETVAALKKHTVVMQSLAATNQKLFKDIEGANASSKIPFRLSANVGEAYGNPPASTVNVAGASEAQRENPAPTAGGGDGDKPPRKS